MNSETWTHLGMMGTVLVPLLLFWLDTRKHTAKNHTENQVRLKEIETKLDTVWDWWVDRKSNGGNGR